MSFLRKRRDVPEAAAPRHALPATPLVTLAGEPEIIKALSDEMARARRYARPLSVLCVMPQLLPGEALHDEERMFAEQAIERCLRHTDRIGVLDDGAFFGVLTETDADAAWAAAQRISNELSLRSAAVNRQNWLAGAVPYDGIEREPSTVLAQAVQAAANSRRRRHAS